MSADIFKNAQKEHNSREESCRVSLEGRLRQDTFEALQALNAEARRGEDVPEMVQGNAGRNRGRNGDGQELVDVFGQFDQRDRLDVAGARLGIHRSADIFDAAQREYDNGSRQRGSGIRRTSCGLSRSESIGAFQVWTMGLEEVVDGAEANLGQREGDEDVAKVLNRIDERSRQHTMHSLGIIAPADIFEAVQKEYEGARGKRESVRRGVRGRRDTQGNGAAIGRDGSVLGDATVSVRMENNAGLGEFLGHADVGNQRNVMRTSVGMRSLGVVFDEAKREHEEARARGIPKGTRNLAGVFDEAKRKDEEVRARGTLRRKRTQGQRYAEAGEVERQATGDVAEVLGRSDERNRQDMLRADLGIRTSAEIFEASQREYEEARARGESKRRRIRGPRDVQRDEAAACLDGSVSGDAVVAVQGRGEDMGRTENNAIVEELLGGADVRDRVSEIRASLGMRTSAEIFEASQKEFEEARARRESIRRRTRWRRNTQSSESSANDQSRPKRVTMVMYQGRNESQDRSEGQERIESEGDELAGVIRGLDEEFAEKERLSYRQTWCTPISLDRKVSTVQEFYSAFHDAKTLPTHTCKICYRKFGLKELENVHWARWRSIRIGRRHISQFSCEMCFPAGGKILGCAECVRDLGKGVLSPAAYLHDRLGCEHMFPEELKGLTPVEEKLIALNSCYGLITKYSLCESQRQSVRYPKHVKGHITVFPNNVQELVANVLPHPLVRVMDEIHVSWQGAEKPAPKDLSVLLSVRRRVVEKALVWLKRNNPLYANIEINLAEMESWGAPPHGVPSEVYDRLERNEPSAWEKTRTAQLVPPSERGLGEGKDVDVREVLAMLSQGQDVETGESEAEIVEGQGLESSAIIQEISSSGMFALDGQPDVADAEKLQYVCDALGQDASSVGRSGNSWVGSAEVRRGEGLEPYVLVSRGDGFADSHDVRFFAKAFPTLFPVGDGGPRRAEENMADLTGDADEESTAVSILSSRNLSLGKWAQLVLQRHGGRFANHHIFAFLVFNMLVRFRNHRVSMMSVTRRNFPEVERIVRSLGAERLATARRQLEVSGKTTDEDVNQLLRSLSLYGYRQPMSRELRLSMRRKIKSLIIRHGTPAIWFTLNPNDITNPVKLRLAAYRTREAEEAEGFLASLDMSYKRARLAVSDPLSSALFFHREISMFFKHYVRVGQESVFGCINEYFGAVETNERGSLHLHGLLWLQGNIGLTSILNDVGVEGRASYQERVIQYVDSVFTEDLDQEAFCAVKAERSVTSDVSSMLRNRQQFSAAFDEEANFCAGATQIHTHSPTCVKYSIGKSAKNKDLCRFKAPWRLVEKTGFTEDGVLQIERHHSTVNRWNKAIAVGLRHNHDISFIGTQSKTMAVVFYVTNYATKVEDPVWKRVAAAADVLNVFDGSSTENGAGTGQRSTEAITGNRARQFLVRVANRVFTERAVSQVEVVAHLLGYPTEFAHNEAWTFLNVSALYWHIFRRWPHLRCASGRESEETVDETVLLEETGQRISLLQAYPHRGKILQNLSLYDYMSAVRLKRRGGKRRAWGETEFDETWPPSKAWVQVLRKPGKNALVCLDGYLSMDFSEESELYYRRAAIQHLAIFVPWELFLTETSGDINAIWERQRQALPRRLLFVAENIQLLRRSAEDAKHDAKQWAALSGEIDPAAEAMESAIWEEDDDVVGALYRSDDIGNTTRLIDVFRSTMGVNQITADSKDVATMVQNLSRFQEAVQLDGLSATIVVEGTARAVSTSMSLCAGVHIPGQDRVKSIKSQQTSLSRDRERMIQGIQERPDYTADSHSGAVSSALNGFGEGDVVITPTDSGAVVWNMEPSASIQFGPSTSFFEVGMQLAESFTLNGRQSVALRLLCRHLDRVKRGERGVPQLCQFIGGEGGTGKSRIIEALVKLFARKGMSHRLLVTATSGTAAARINGITIHSACNFSKDMSRLGTNGGPEQLTIPRVGGLRVDGRVRMDWQEKDVLVIDEVSMLGARTLYAVNERLCELRGCAQDFGNIPTIVFLGDFHQFRPVQERSILLPSSDFPWDQGKAFGVEQRYQHDRAHALWKRFTTVVMLKEQVRAAADPRLQQLLARIRQGMGDQNDVDLLNSTCYQEGRRIPWESGITVVTSLNRNRWNLNAEAALSFQRQYQAPLRIFISKHKWKDGQPTEEEAFMMLSYGDDSSIPIPAVFMFVPGMPVIVNQNIYQGLKLVNGAGFTALDIIVDKAHPGHRISADTILHFGPPAGILLAGESTKDLHFVGMPPGTILLTPISLKIECQRKRPWQKTDVSRRGLPCAPAFACTDYKVQGQTLKRVALELRGTRTANINGQAVASQCDPYSLYVQLSRTQSLDDIMLLSKARERDIVGNTIPENMAAAEKRLEELSEATIREAESWGWSSPME